MIAVDTNVLVRIVVEDDANQVARARAFMDVQDRVFISKTVLLEMGWVLGTYRLTREAIVSAIRRILAVSNVVVEDNPAVMLALEWYERGMDFADALHLASLTDETPFATFDISMVRTAGRLGGRAGGCYLTGPAATAGECYATF